MRITSIALHRYLPFLFNEIELLEMDLTSPVQNVTGSNGAGKSSLLRELNPRPATRSDYGEGGYKHITLEHNGLEYRLESNFATVSKPHSFVRGTEELNPSGTSSIQEELVRGELGYTPQVHNLCYGEQRLSSIRVGLRETYLLTIHPCQMKLLLDEHKAIERKLRGCRDNLSLLLERRTALNAQMIEPELLSHLKAENTQLTQELATVIGAIHRLTNERRNLEAAIASQPSIPAIREKSDLLKAQRRYPGYGEIDRIRSIEEHRSLLSGDIGSYRSRLEASTQRIRAVTMEIDKYEQHLQRNDAQAAIDVIEAALQTLRADIAELQDPEFDKPFDPFYLEDVPNHINRLSDLISPFIGYTAPIPAARDVQRMQNRYENNARRLAACERDATVLSDKLSGIESHLREHVLDDIQEGCHGCALYRQYSTTVKRLQADYGEVDGALRRVRVRKARLQLLVNGCGERMTSFNRIVPQMQQLERYLNDNRFLLVPLQDLDLLRTLQQNPSLLLVRVQSHYERSRKHFLRLKKIEELNRPAADYERLKSPSEYSQQFLEALIVEKKEELETLRQTYRSVLSGLAEKEAALATLTDYVRETQRLNQDRQAFDQQETAAVLNFDRELCDIYLSSLGALKIKTVTRLAEIDRTLREQDGLAAARQEILNTLGNIEAQQREYLDLERALSPSNGIPYRYMVQFINDIIEVANPFISEVFSYPFEFIPLVDGDPLNYKFRMRVGDVIVPDISSCSDAQKDFADLAFRLAQIIQLKQTGYAIYLDECDKTFDHYHKIKLLDLLKTLVPDGVVEQMFMINHNLAMYSGMSEAEILVLNENNIVLPQTYNEHVRILHYR